MKQEWGKQEVFDVKKLSDRYYRWGNLGENPIFDLLCGNGCSNAFTSNTCISSFLYTVNQM